jgi:hypothetical protein
MRTSHLSNPNKEQVVLKRTIDGLKISKKYQQLKQKTQEEIIDLIFDISYNPVEI